MMQARTRILIRNMQRDGKLPPWPEGTVTPVILTGLEALSRERDVSRGMQVANVAQAFGPDAVDVLKLDKILSRITIGLGFEDSVRSDGEAQARRQQRSEQEAAVRAAQAAAPQVAKAATQGG